MKGGRVDVVDLMGGAALEGVYDSLRSGVSVPHGPRAEAGSLVCAKGRSRVSLVNHSDDAEKQLTLCLSLFVSWSRISLHLAQPTVKV